MAKSTLRVNQLLRACFRQLPEQPYPSDHPWSKHHDPQRPRG